ncbi:AbrB family transcriptional regulator [Candidatus Pacearchaeota archaeon]|nr:AbrB family transcriptional regulator [Candidatus Pacearchaeota archaeon]|tara:strand:- start:1536 stop:1775 length:240 start_codon:yes stop_codon:yes gene_type:complete
MIIKRELGEKGQIVIPKDIRNILDLKEREQVTLEVREDSLILKKEEDPIDIVEDFFNTPKLKKIISIKKLKKIAEEQYG